MATTKLTPKQLLDRMRKTTADLLGYDLTVKLTAAQSVRLDRAATLRLELDDIQGRQLAGLPIDTDKFVAASESLELLVGGNPETPTATPDFAGAEEELAHLLFERAERIKARDSRLRDEVARLTEENAKLQAKLRAAEEQQPIQPSNNVVQIDATARANANLPPAHYLKDGQPREAWRDGPAFNVPSWPLPR